MTIRICLFLILIAIAVDLRAQALQAPAGMFKDLNDEILAGAVLVEGKQLFIDDHIIDELSNVRKALNQPTKHAKNPLVKRDRPSEGWAIAHGSVIRDPRDGMYQLWYTVWQGTLEDEKKGLSKAQTAYARSSDGITWEKPVVNEKDQSNIVTFSPEIPWAGGASVIIDENERDPSRRYKMMVLAMTDGTSKTLCICAAYSPDGMRWTQEPANPVASWGDGPPSLYYDAARKRYVVHTRFWPPNTRRIAQIESEDFVHWTPKFTIFDHRGPGGSPSFYGIDQPFSTAYQMMAALPYAGNYIGLLTVHHGETIKPIPADQQWMDKLDVQLAFSRTGVTWQRVGPEGAIPAGQQQTDEKWKRIVEGAAFLPYGEQGKDWDWGWTMNFEPPFVVVGDEIRIYYLGVPARHWWNYHSETPDVAPEYGLGLATLRLDGFVSVNAGDEEGTLTTKPLAFIGDAIEVNADATGGSLQVEALDADGKAIEGFSRDDCEPLAADSVHHMVKWKASGTNAQLLQARPIRLRFYLCNAKLFSFTPRIAHSHFIPSYE